MAQKTRAQLLADISASFADNHNHAIIPALLRTFLSDGIDSSLIPLTDGVPGDFQASGSVYVDGVFGDNATGQRLDIGKPFRTIQAAISAALSGDVVIPRPGVYTENLTFVTGVHLYCESPLMVVVNGNTTINTCVQTTSNIKLNGNIVVSAGHPVFMGCELDPAGHFVTLKAAADVVAVNCVVKGTLVDFDTPARFHAQNCTLASVAFAHGSTLYTDVSSLPLTLGLTNGSLLALLDQSQGIGFDDGANANWNTPPTSVKEALQQLVARVKALEP